MDSLVVFDTEDSNYLDRQPMVKMASKESSPPPPSFLGFAVHQSITFSEILFLRQIHILLLRSTKNPRRFSIL